MEQHVKEMSSLIGSYEEKKQKLETDQKASIDKIFVLREVIADLEGQVETKSLNEHVLSEKIKILDAYVSNQTAANESLHDESLKLEHDVHGYREQIARLEEQLRSARPSVEQCQMTEMLAAQLKEIEVDVERKTRLLESLHTDICSASCSEDVSVTKDSTAAAASSPSPRRASDDVQRIADKLVRHNRAEEAAIKRIRDLEMQLDAVRTSHDVSVIFFLFIFNLR